MVLIVLHRNASLIQRFIRLLALAVEPRPKGVPKSTFCLNNHNKIKYYVYIFIYTIRCVRTGIKRAARLHASIKETKSCAILGNTNITSDFGEHQYHVRFQGTPIQPRNTETALSEAALSGVLL